MRARNGRMQALKCSKTRKVNTSKYDMNYIIYIYMGHGMGHGTNVCSHLGHDMCACKPHAKTLSPMLGASHLVVTRQPQSASKVLGFGYARVFRANFPMIS